MQPPSYSKLPDRFWDKVDEPNTNGCWLWNASTRTTGYGQFSYQGKPAASHRLSFIDASGSQPKHGLILHHCDVKLCVNPCHLYDGTHKDNYADMVKRNRTNQAVGVQFPCSILTDNIVRRARELRDRSHISYGHLGTIYGVHRGTMRQAILGQTWKHVT